MQALKNELSSILNVRFVIMNAFSVADPSVTRYHVQWLPEYCSHNETRGPEKSVTQVSSYPSALLVVFVRGHWC